MTRKMLRTLFKGAKKFAATGLAVPALLLLCQGRAEAILNYYIFEDGGNLKIVTRGSLTLDGITSGGGSTCTTPPPGGAIAPGFALICSGEETTGSDPYKKYIVTSSSSSSSSAFSEGSGNLSATSTSGIRNWLFGSENPNPSFYIIASYNDGTPIDSSATFNGKTLNDLNLNSLSPNLNIGSWTFLEDTNPTNVINVIVGSPPTSSPAPGPLPLLGATAAYAWSRRLRRRIGSSSNR
jgi:hypothetical protein